ncbi:MAG TPA: PhzF family phenazine biosynthesis protein [Cyclobacteriaceae bacterium]
MVKLEYFLLDVFTNKMFGGNPLAVFLDGQVVPNDKKQSIAKELNLSETVYISPSYKAGCDYKFEIFTPEKELPTAGHPTIGGTFILMRRINYPSGANQYSLVLEEGIGPINVEILIEKDIPRKVTMEAPLPEFKNKYDNIADFAALLGLAPRDISKKVPIQTVSCGLNYTFIPINSLQAVQSINFNLTKWHELAKSGVESIYTFTLETVNTNSNVHGRMFAPGLGVLEDPATGSANGPLGSYLVNYNLLPAGEIQSEQGFEMERPSTIYIDVSQSQEKEIDAVKISGECVHAGQGQLYLDY